MLKGRTKIHVTQATMQEAMTHWLKEKVLQKDVGFGVANVKADPGEYGETHFIVELSDAEGDN